MSAFPKTYKVIVSDTDKVRACWFNSGNLLHNEEGPAVEYANDSVDGVGGVEYRQNGKLHRVDGPAIVHADWSDRKEWHQYGMLHREEGPAVKFVETSGTVVEQYWLEGFEYDKEEWEEEIKRRNGLGLLLSSDKKTGTIPGKIDNQWSWTTNPTPPKHPFCGECGLATAYLYSPNLCRSCGTTPEKAIQALAAREKPHCLRSYCLNGKEECGCPCEDCVADKLVIASMMDNSHEHVASSVIPSSKWQKQCSSCPKIVKENELNYPAPKWKDGPGYCDACMMTMMASPSLTPECLKHPSNCSCDGKMTGQECYKSHNWEAGTGEPGTSHHKNCSCHECTIRINTTENLKATNVLAEDKHPVGCSCGGIGTVPICRLSPKEERYPYCLGYHSTDQECTCIERMQAFKCHGCGDKFKTSGSSMVWCGDCVGKSTPKQDTFSTVLDCYGCSKPFMRGQLTFPGTWVDYGYCQKCIKDLGPHWKTILLGDSPARTKSVPNSPDTSSTILPEGSNFIKFGSDEVPNRRQAVVNEQPDNNRRSVVQPPTVTIDQAVRRCDRCSVLVNIAYAKAVIEGWLCQECYVFRGEDRTPFCIHCGKRSGKDRIDTVRGWACQRCHRGATIAAVS